jgi:hypothetical protein
MTQSLVHLYLGSQALEVGGPSGLSADAGLTAGAGLWVEQVGAQIPLRAQVCASQSTRETAYAGAPANGNVVAWKRVPVADGKHCDYTWFEWVPSVRGDHTLVAEVLQDQDDPHPGQNQASLNVEVVGP